MSSSAVNFKGKSGERYRFQALPLNAKFKAVSGVYVVTKRSFEDKTFQTKAVHHALAIGQTVNFAAPFLSKAELARLQEKGANCMCLYAHEDEARRLEIEKDLVEGSGDLLHYLFDITAGSASK